MFEPQQLQRARLLQDRNCRMLRWVGSKLKQGSQDFARTHGSMSTADDVLAAESAITRAMRDLGG